MKRKSLLLIFGFLWVMVFNLCAQDLQAGSNRRVAKYPLSNVSMYEHQMFLTCQLFEGDRQIVDFEIAVIDQNGEVRANGISGGDENFPSIAYAIIHGTSGREGGFIVRVVYGDETDRYKYDRLVEGLVFNMSSNDIFGNTLDPYRIVLPAKPSFSWAVGNGPLQEAGFDQLTPTLLQGATRLNLRGTWAPEEVEKLKAALPTSTLQDVRFSGEWAKFNLSGLLSNCSALTSVHFKAVPEGDVTDFLAGANPNCLIYLPEGTTTFPAEWNNMNVVCHSATGYTALTDITLVGSTVEKQCPFTLDKDIQLDGHTATFIPAGLRFANGKGGWNTIVLPFDAEPYADNIRLRGNRNDKIFRNCYWLMSYGGGDAYFIDFAYERNGLTANIPYLFTVPGDKFGPANSLQQKEITFRSSGDVIYAVPAKIHDPYFDDVPQDIEFLGTYTTRLAQPMYLLADMKSGANAFVYAEKGNILPFRAYMQMREGVPATAQILMINEGYLPTGIDGVECEAADEEVFDVSGRRVSDFGSAKSGIYIINGNKQLKK